MEQNYLIGQGLLKAVIGYLAAKPYSETFKLIAGLQQLKPEAKVEEAKIEKPKA